MDTKAVIHSNLKEYEEAIRFFNECLKVDPQHSGTISRLELLEKIQRTGTESVTKISTPEGNRDRSGSKLADYFLRRARCKLCEKVFEGEMELHKHVRTEHR
ncbi:MAG: tetratricopeptide repeat protein [Nitrososphaerota archaeon]